MQAQTAATPPTTLAGQDFMVRAGQLFFRVRDVLFPLIFFGLAFVSRPLPAGGSSSTDALLDAVGIAVALSGQLLRALVIGFAYVRRGGKDKQIYADSLQQEGFFAHCRNPLYVGNFLALVGFCIIHNSLLCYLVGIPFFAFAYMAIIAGEERYLGGRFGAAYVDYCRRVPRIVPSFKGLGKTLEGMQFDWKRLIRKEYGSTYAGICAVLVLIVWEHYIWQGWPGCRPAVTGALAVWAPATLAYLVARHLKKSGRLGTGN